MKATERNHHDLIREILIQLVSRETDLDFVAGNLERYTNLLSQWNQRFKFTNLKSATEIFNSLVLPSLVHSTLIAEKARVVCLGSGPGIPGLIVKLVRPDIDINLVDSNGRAVEFMKAALTSLGIKNATVISARAEILAHNADYRSTFDCVISRAFASAPVVSEIASGYLVPGGHLVIQCAETISSMAKNRDLGLNKIRQSFDRVQSISIPSPVSEIYNYSVIRQIAPPALCYPRDWKKIQAAPLWS